MSHIIKWYIQDEVIYHYMAGEITADELRESVSQLKQLIDSSPRPLVHIIADQGDLTQAMNFKEALDTLRETGFPQKMGWAILLRENSILFKMGSALALSLFKMRTRSFSTLGEAEEFLKKMDSTINWDNVDKSVLVE